MVRNDSGGIVGKVTLKPATASIRKGPTFGEKTGDFRARSRAPLTLLQRPDRSCLGLFVAVMRVSPSRR